MNAWIDEEGRLRAGWRFVLGLMVAAFATMVSTWAAEAAAHNHFRGFAFVYGALSSFLLIMAFCALLASADRAEHPVRHLGFPREHWLRDWLAGAGTGTLMIAVAVTGIAIIGKLSFRWTFNWDIAALLLVEVVVIAVNALSEELMFRSYPLQTLVDGGSVVFGVVVTSALFGSAHLGNPHSSAFAIVNTIFVGALLAIGRVRSRALWFPWGIHFGWNLALGVLFGLPVSGLNEFAVAVHGRAGGPSWLTGGAYGIEGGALGTLAIAAGFLPVLLWTSSRRAPLPLADQPLSGAE